MYKLMLPLVFVISGCASQGITLGKSTKPTVPQKTDSRLACPTRAGTVLTVSEPLTIQSNVAAGQSLGGALGGYLGYLTSSEPITRTLATVAGAVAGVWVGDKASKRQYRDGQELVVAINDEVYSVLHEVDNRVFFEEGDTVWVIGNLNENGRVNTACKNGIRVMPR